METDFFSLKKGLGFAQYLIAGDGLDFLPQISFYTGLRLAIEKKAIQYRLNKITLPHHEKDAIHKAISKIEQFLGSPAGKWQGLFLYTSSYKNTIFVGCAKTQSTVYFLKAFKTDDSAREEKKNIETLSGIYGQWFEIPKIILYSDKLLVLSFIKRHAMADRQAVCRLLANAAETWKNKPEIESGTLDNLLDRLFLLIPHLNHTNFNKNGIRHLFEAIHDQMKAKWSKYPLYLVHGDMTPWNTYLSSSDRIALVDAECIGPRPLYSDLLHFHIQPKAVSRFSSGSAASFIPYLCKWAAVKPEEAQAYIILYLLKELSQDMQDLAAFHDQRILARAVKRKLGWLDAIIKKT